MKKPRKDSSNIGKYFRSKKIKNKIRKSVSRHIKEVGGPLLGKHETQILDNVEEFIGFPIIRQYPVCGYFVDGYLKKGNMVFEVDERPKVKERDIERENIIISKLNCNLIRIPLYEKN